MPRGERPGVGAVGAAHLHALLQPVGDGRHHGHRESVGHEHPAPRGTAAHSRRLQPHHHHSGRILQVVVGGVLVARKIIVPQLAESLVPLHGHQSAHGQRKPHAQQPVSPCVGQQPPADGRAGHTGRVTVRQCRAHSTARDLRSTGLRKVTGHPAMSCQAVHAGGPTLHCRQGRSEKQEEEELWTHHVKDEYQHVRYGCRHSRLIIRRRKVGQTDIVQCSPPPFPIWYCKSTKFILQATHRAPFFSAVRHARPLSPPGSCHGDQGTPRVSPPPPPSPRQREAMATGRGLRCEPCAKGRGAAQERPSRPPGKCLEPEAACAMTRTVPGPLPSPQSRGGRDYQSPGARIILYKE